MASPGQHAASRECAHCGKVFTPRDPSRRFCSHDCAQRGGAAGQGRGRSPQQNVPGRGPGPSSSTLGTGGQRHTVPIDQPTSVVSGYLTPAFGYLTGGYFDAEGNLLPSVVEVNVVPKGTAGALQLGRAQLDPASMVARAVYALAMARPSTNEAGIAYTQLRRFYQQALSIERRLRLEGDFAAIRGDLAMLRPKAAMAVQRGLAPEAFKDFIDTNVALAATGTKALRRGFLQHFHAVLCYYRYFNPSSEQTDRRR